MLTLVPVVWSLWHHNDVHMTQKFLLNLGKLTESKVAKLDPFGKKRKKRDELYNKRAQLREKATVTTIKIEGTLEALTDSEYRLCKQAVREACWKFVDKDSVTKVRLLPGPIVAKIFCDSSATKMAIDKAVLRDELIVHFQNKQLTAKPVRYYHGHVLSSAGSKMVLAAELSQRSLSIRTMKNLDALRSVDHTDAAYSDNNSPEDEGEHDGSGTPNDSDVSDQVEASEDCSRESDVDGEQLSDDDQSLIPANP